MKVLHASTVSIVVLDIQWISHIGPSAPIYCHTHARCPPIASLHSYAVTASSKECTLRMAFSVLFLDGQGGFLHPPLLFRSASSSFLRCSKVERLVNRFNCSPSEASGILFSLMTLQTVRFSRRTRMFRLPRCQTTPKFLHNLLGGGSVPYKMIRAMDVFRDGTSVLCLSRGTLIVYGGSSGSSPASPPAFCRSSP